jgi:hypothetical protein
VYMAQQDDATVRARAKGHDQDHRKCHRCLDAELSPMSCDMTLPLVGGAP